MMQQTMGTDSFDFGDAAPTDGRQRSSACIAVRITRTEESTSMMMQRFTAYVIEVSDFGRVYEVPHRYSDYEALYKALQAVCPGVNFPPMPPKGVDGTDASVVAMRKVELEKILRFMLTCPEVMMERELQVWKFLNLPNPAVIASRFVELPRAREGCLKQLTKLMDTKYKDDLYRVGHPCFTALLLEGLKELRSGDAGSGHWCWQNGGRSAICQLLAGALQSSEEARQQLLDDAIMGLLLGIVEREETSLDDARFALNVIVAKEGDRFGSILADYLSSGGLSQLNVLVQRTRCQEFVSKLLWLGWDSPVRLAFARPGGPGLKVLQVLIKSTASIPSMLGAVLLAGLTVDELKDSAHRSEAIELVRGALGVAATDAASDPQFAKTLCGGNAAVARLATMVEDVEVAPIILGLLCAAKPPAAKLSRMEGNLAALVGGRSAGHRAETQAKAAELLLHIQGSASSGQTSTSPLGASSGATTGAAAGGAAAGAGAGSGGLERCEGMTAHEESIEKAMRWQLEDGLGKSRDAMQQKSAQVSSARSLGFERVQSASPLPPMTFAEFERAYQSFKLARETLEKNVVDSTTLHQTMEKQLEQLQASQPSSTNDAAYKERLAKAEHLYSDVKRLRQELSQADAEAKEKQATAEASSSEMRRALEAVKRLDDEISKLKKRKDEAEGEASKFRQKASLASGANVAADKQSAAERLEKCTAQIRELQVIGQRVQQGDPDYLKDGESRDQKIAELAAKLSQLKKQQQALQKEQEEINVDPSAMEDSARRFETEASELELRLSTLESQRLDADRERVEKSSVSTREVEDAKNAQERRSNLASRLGAAEAEAKSHLASLQPEIQANHSRWQKLIDQQRKLDTDNHLLENRLAEVGKAADAEEQRRSDLRRSVSDVISRLQGFQAFLDGIASGSSSTAAASPAPAFSASADISMFEDAPAKVSSDFSPVVPTASTPKVDDDFDDFLQESNTSGSAKDALPKVEAEPAALDEL